MFSTLDLNVEAFNMKTSSEWESDSVPSLVVEIDIGPRNNFVLFATNCVHNDTNSIGVSVRAVISTLHCKARGVDWIVESDIEVTFALASHDPLFPVALAVTKKICRNFRMLVWSTSKHVLSLDFSFEIENVHFVNFSWNFPFSNSL